MAARKTVDVLKAEAQVDVLADEAQKAEEDRYSVVEFRGLELKIDKDPNEWDLEVMEAYEDGKLIPAIRGLLGDVQWAKIKRLKLKMKDLGELVEKVLGVSPEKSDS